MPRTTRAFTCAFTTACVVAILASTIVAAEEPQSDLSPEATRAIAERVKVLAEHGPKGATLAAFLNCGVQAETAKDSPVGIKKLQGESYTFAADDVDVPDTQPTVFFDAERVVFELSGIERTGRYMVGLTWWDFDGNSRSEMVTVSSSDRRNVRIAIPAIGLPSYKPAEELPAQKQFTLPATFAKDGKMQLAVVLAGGANAVISELWVWQLEK